ncbi:MAG: cobalt ECF transporter T component CbiQ [Geobacter sp.]|nr:cobalt ECF transporter T component CbiQ [Geobacter sp.]
MSTFDGAILDFKRLETLASGDTTLHRLDPRAKVIVTALFIMAVVSHDRYAITRLFPFFIFPAALIAAGNLPLAYIIRKVLLLCPFAIVVGIFNPLIDRTIVLQLGDIGISGGWLSFASIIVRSTLTVGTAFVLLALTGFPAICRALEQLGIPKLFAAQLLFLYRYIFVLTEEAGRASRARELRSCGKKGQGMTSFATMVGHLLLRTWQRAERIHVAMLSRGFDGSFRTSRKSSLGSNECIFIALWGLFLVTARILDLPKLIGTFITGGF